MTSTNYYKLGAFVLGGIVLAMVSLVWLGATDWNRTTRQLVTYFDESVQGLEVGSAIKFRGVTVGTVSEISVASDLRHVRVTSLVYQDVLRRLGLAEEGSTNFEQAVAGDSALRVQLVSSGVTGVKFLSIDFFDKRRFPEEKLPFDPGPDYLPSTPSTLKSIEEAAVEVGVQLPMLTMRASETLLRLANSVENLERSLQPLLAEDGSIARVLQQYERTGAQIERSVAVFETELKAAQLPSTAASLRNASTSIVGFASDMSVTAEDARESMATLQATLDSIKALSDYLERDPAALVRGRAPGNGRGPRP